MKFFQTSYLGKWAGKQVHNKTYFKTVWIYIETKEIKLNFKAGVKKSNGYYGNIYRFI